MTRRTFDDAIATNARVQIDTGNGEGIYHLYFAIGTEAYRCSKALTSTQMEKILYLEGYKKIDEQDNGRIKMFAK